MKNAFKQVYFVPIRDMSNVTTKLLRVVVGSKLDKIMSSDDMKRAKSINLISKNKLTN